MSLPTDEPTVLPIGTDVSAKYKGAFCEAKIKKINRNVKCKLTVKDTNSLATIDDELIISGSLRVGSHVVFKHNGQPADATVNKILDQSFYTVVFDDGDEATLKRSSLCLKSGKHFAESETLDQLPLTNPEHFGNPVSLGRRRRRRHHNSDSDEEDVDDSESRSPPERDADWGKVVCVDYGDKRGSKKDIWFPAVIVAPTAQDATTKMSKDEYLVRSFRDGRFYKVNKKDAREFTKETVLSKSESNSSALRSAMEKAIAFMDKQELPNHWDYDLLMGNVIPQIEEEVDTSEEFDSALDDSDDEQSEEKDRFVAQLYKYMDERGTPINRAPSVGGKDLNLYKLYRIVVKMGGYNRVTNKNSWRTIYSNLGLPASITPSGKESAAVLQLKAAYKKFLHSFDDFYRKLGCTIVVNSRTSRPSRGERIREERPSAKKSVKKEKESKKEEPKEEKEVKETPVVAVVAVVADVPIVAKVAKDKDKEKEKEKEKERDKEREKEKEKEKEIPVKEEVKPEEIKTVIKDIPKEDIKIKTEDNPALDERKRGRGRKKREEEKDGPPGDDDTMTEQSTIDESDEEDHKSSKIDESMIKVGDGLKVKYGRGRQLKVYEAKVLKLEADPITNKRRYFVHYSGWNSRYDEWIKKARIVTVLRDRSPRRRSGKMKNKGETLQELTTPPNSGNNNQSSAIPSTSSQNSVSSNDESSRQSLQSQPPKRGRPPNSGKSSAVKEVTVKEEPKTQPSIEKQSQPSPQSSQTTDPKVGRRGRPPLSAKKDKLTRSKSINEDQSTNESFATSSIAEESTSKAVDDRKSVANLSSDSEIMDKCDDKEVNDEVSVETKSVQPPELHDENTVENRLTDEEPLIADTGPVAIKLEPTVVEQQTPVKTIAVESYESVSPATPQKAEVEDKKEPQNTPVKDAFDFDDEEVLKEEEPLKEQLKKKRKSKDDGKKANKSIATSSDKTEKTSSKEVSNDDNSVRDNGRSNSFSRKSSKKSRKSVPDPIIEKPVINEVVPVIEELPPPVQKETPIKVEEEDKQKLSNVTKTKSVPISIESPPQPKQSETKPKRKGRKRKDDESVPPVKKKIKPTKLELHEEDSNLEVQKLFESYGCSTPPQELDISPVEELKVLPLFTADINPPQMESVSSDFLICEEAVPASPEKAPNPDEQMDDSMPPHESPHSFHSSPTQSPKELADKEAKCSGGSNSELENEPIISAKDSTNKLEMFPSPTHDEDSMISRPELNKSPISPKKRRRGRIRTVSQSDNSHPKERIGCKTRGSSGRSRAERQSPLTALEHRMPFSLTPISFDNFIPESKYNFCKPLDDSIDADKRINILQERLQELRKTYMNIKQEVTSLERKKKKARRKEKERKDINSCHKHTANHSHNYSIVDNIHVNHSNSTHKVLSTISPSAGQPSISASTTATGLPGPQPPPI